MGPRGTGEVRRGEAPATPAPGPNPEGRGRKSPPRTGLSACATKRRKVRGTTSPGRASNRRGEAVRPARHDPTPHRAFRRDRSRPLGEHRRRPSPDEGSDDERRYGFGEPPGRRSPNRVEAPGSTDGGSTATGPAGAVSPRRVRVLAGAGGAAAEVAADAGARVRAPVPARRPVTAPRPRMAGATTKAPSSSDGDTATVAKPRRVPPRQRAPRRRTSSPRSTSTPSPARSSARRRVHARPARAGVSRGGRGRGRGGVGFGDRVRRAARRPRRPSSATETVPESPDGQTRPTGNDSGNDGQRRPGRRRRRSRGGRGRSKAKPAGETAEAADADGREPAPKPQGLRREDDHAEEVRPAEEGQGRTEGRRRRASAFGADAPPPTAAGHGRRCDAGASRCRSCLGSPTS